MAYFFQDSDDEYIDSEESEDEEFDLSDCEPESEDDYDSDRSDFEPFDEEEERASEEATATLFMSKDKKIQYTLDPPPLGRPVGRSSFSNKGW